MNPRQHQARSQLLGGLPPDDLTARQLGAVNTLSFGLLPDQLPDVDLAAPERCNREVAGRSEDAMRTLERQPFECGSAQIACLAPDLRALRFPVGGPFALFEGEIRSLSAPGAPWVSPARRRLVGLPEPIKRLREA